MTQGVEVGHVAKLREDPGGVSLASLEEAQVRVKPDRSR